MTSRDTLIEMVVDRYFHAVDHYDLDGVLACFHDDATFTVRSEVPAHHKGIDEIRNVFEELFKAFPHKMMHRDFHHIVDVEGGNIASRFFVELRSVDYEDIFQTNCNFFYVEDGRFKDVHVYMMGQNVLQGRR